jgi:predicted MPP superfamily phosphohydrolase
MKLALMSDLHLEFHKDRGKSLTDFILENVPNCDLIALAGDIGVIYYDYDVIKSFLLKLSNKGKVVFIPGNHCYYNTSYEDAKNLLKILQQELQYLNINVITTACEWFQIDKFNILAGTLWFSNLMPTHDVKSWLNDFHVKNIESYIYKENNEFIYELEHTNKPNIITITHHSPSYNSVPPRFANSALNQFFCNNLNDILKEKEVILTCHGHLHDAVDYKINTTRVISNPAGYLNEIKADWKPLIIKI